MTDTADAIDESAERRHALVVSQLRPNNVTDARLLAAMARIDRQAFVPAERRAMAYTDRAIPIANGRALNPPLTTALLLDSAAIGSGDRVLIVGAATGYAVAIAYELAAQVVAIESDTGLADAVRRNVPGVDLVVGSMADGATGEFDAIVIDGAVEFVPDALIAQLASDGRLTCAIGRGPVSRLAVGRRGGTGFALAEFADAEAVPLPGFARAREFVF